MSTSYVLRDALGSSLYRFFTFTPCGETVTVVGHLANGTKTQNVYSLKGARKIYRGLLRENFCPCVEPISFLDLDDAMLTARKRSARQDETVQDMYHQFDFGAN